jgi:hypothetical protein
MTVSQLQKKIASVLPEGKASLETFFKDSLVLQLQEVNKKIAVFEGKYNKDFSEFQSAWKKWSTAKRRSYETEVDYMDWEALEDYKRDLMRVIYSL